MESVRGVPLEWLVDGCPIRAEQIRRRGDAILAHLGKAATPNVVEVGVYDGALARYLFNRHPGLYWLGVDCWCAPEPNSPYARTGDGTAHVGQAKLHLAYLHTLMNLYRFGQKLVYPGPSELAARLWDEGEFDLVFIDADHSFEGVSADLRAWWPLVTPGGWLSGHDWGLYGVTDAAEAWLPEVGLSLKDVELADETCWFIRKVA